MDLKIFNFSNSFKRALEHVFPVSPLQGITGMRLLSSLHHLTSTSPLSKGKPVQTSLSTSKHQPQMGCFLRIWGTLTSSNWSWNVSIGFLLLFSAVEVLWWIVGFKKSVPFSKICVPFSVSSLNPGKTHKSGCLTCFQVGFCERSAWSIFELFIEGKNTKRNKTGNINYKNDTDLKRVFKIACQNYFLKIYVFSSVCFSILFHGCFGNRGKKEKRDTTLISTARSRRAENLHMIFKSHKKSHKNKSLSALSVNKITDLKKRV